MTSLEAVRRLRRAAQRLRLGCVLCCHGCRWCGGSSIARALGVAEDHMPELVVELDRALRLAEAAGFAGERRGLYGGEGSFKRLVGDRWVSPAEQRAEVESAMGALAYLLGGLERGESPKEGW